jgi:peptidoglycan/xylan/chitin deacetylase (PgdA/CDA1 family)
MNARIAVRASIARLMFMAGATAPGRRGRDRLSIVTFHRVLPESHRVVYPYPGLVITPHELDAVLAYLTTHFDCGALASQHQRFVAASATDRPLLALTFDDGQHDNFLYARPMLAEYRVKATFFIPVAALERRELLWHDRLGFGVLALLQGSEDARERLVQAFATAGIKSRDPACLGRIAVSEAKRLDRNARLRLVDAVASAAGAGHEPEFARLMNLGELSQLADDGHEIGSHSMTHCMMPECSDVELAYEVAESRRILQARTGQPIESFCYPNGDADSRSASAAAQAGYCRAVTTSWGPNVAGADPYRLSRFEVDHRRVQDASGKFLPALLALRMSGLNPWLR